MTHSGTAKAVQSGGDVVSTRSNKAAARPRARGQRFDTLVIKDGVQRVERLAKSPTAVQQVLPDKAGRMADARGVSGADDLLHGIERDLSVSHSYRPRVPGPHLVHVRE